MNAALKLVMPEPSTKDLLRQAITSRDDAHQTVVRHDALIVELGQKLWSEQHPNQRRFGKMRIEEARRLAGLA